MKQTIEVAAWRNHDLENPYPRSMAKPPATAQFGNVLRFLRLNSGLSQEVLAERARMSASTISALERGARRAPYRETVAFLATALDLSPADRDLLESAAERARGRRRRVEPVPSEHNLPTRLTSFVGREPELTEIAQLLDAHRIVTITGSGGIGKTRLALEIGRRLSGRREVRFVDLSPVASKAFVVATIAAAVNVRVAETSDPVHALIVALKTREFTLIVDNCEHLVASAATVISAIAHALPDVVILATSRERLAIDGERVYRLASLPEPASAQLFRERATAIDARFSIEPHHAEVLAETCRRLEGIPLAIELAVTRLPQLGLHELNEQLKKHVTIGSGPRDGPLRQRTLLATIAWSFELLSADEQDAFRRIAVFSGGMTVDAAAEVCAGLGNSGASAAELLPALVDKSLLGTSLVDDQPRFLMLESVRTFALTKLEESGERPRVSRAHASYFAVRGDRAFDRAGQVSPTDWFREHRAELNNVRVALRWALDSEPSEDAVLAARIACGFRHLWLLDERHIECRYWAEAVLARIDSDAHLQLAARLTSLIVAASSGRALLAAAQRALPLYERLGDRVGIIAVRGNVAREYILEGAVDDATRTIDSAFELIKFENPADVRWCIQLLQLRCFIRVYAGRLAAARGDFEHKVTIEAGLGDAPSLAHYYMEALLVFAEGDPRSAAELLEKCAAEAVSSAIGHATPLCDLAAARLVLGDVDRAASAARESLTLARFEALSIAWKAVLHLAVTAALRGRLQAAARLAGFIDAWCRANHRAGGPYESATRTLLGSALEAGLAESDIATLAAEGATMEFDRAVDEALRTG